MQNIYMKFNDIYINSGARGPRRGTRAGRSLQRPRDRGAQVNH